MQTGQRRQRWGDLSKGSTGLQVVLLSNNGTANVSASALGLTTIEAVLSVTVTQQTLANAPVGLVAMLSGTSTVIGVSVIQTAGTTVQLLVEALGL